MILVGCNRCKKYGFFNFIWDVFMVCMTLGFWLIWIFCREMRKTRYPFGSACGCS